VRNADEPCMFPHCFLQNCSSSSPKIISFSKSEDATNSVPDDSNNPLSVEIPHNTEESKEKDSSDLALLHHLKIFLLLLLLKKFISLYLLFPISLRRKTKLMFRR